MSNLVQFTSRAELDAAANLEEFILLAREKLSAFGDGGAWDGNRWQHGKTVVIFATRTAVLTPYKYTPMADPFKQFAKAYVRYHYSHKPVTSLAPMVQALRCVEASLLSVHDRAELYSLTPALMDVSAEKCREFYASEDLRCSTGREIQKIFEFVRKQGFVPGLPGWRSPFKKPRNLTEAVSDDGREFRESKLPTNETMLAVADIFSRANDTESRFFSSILVLLMAAPSRISEIFELGTDCMQWEMDSAGVNQMYLRWHAAKGKGAMKKWVIPAMHDVVAEAIRRLVEVGAEARVAARFAYDNPGIFMQHPGCISGVDEANDRPLGPDEFCAAIDVECRGGGRLLDGTLTWARVVVDQRLESLIKRGATSYRDLAAYVMECFSGPYWPYINEERTVEAWNALCLHRQCEFHKDFRVKNFSWRLPAAPEVNSRLNSGVGRSLFDRHQLKRVDGSSFKITTHQLRHWLSTMSERAGMDDFTLAQWAGRARISDNSHYDHRSTEERFEDVKKLLQIDRPSLLDRIKHRQPVTYQELGVDRLGTAKATMYGMCVHDYAMTPCQKQRECMTCKEHVCIKGDHVTLERLYLLRSQTSDMLGRAQEAHDDGEFGADRWVDNHKWKLAHVTAMIAALEHPQMPDGSLVRIPDGYDPSPVRRTLMDIGIESQVPAEMPYFHGLPAMSD